MAAAFAPDDRAASEAVATTHELQVRTRRKRLADPREHECAHGWIGGRGCERLARLVGHLGQECILRLRAIEEEDGDATLFDPVLDVAMVAHGAS